MEIKLIQCSIGRYYLGSSEKNLSFSLGIYEDGKVITDENGTKAILHFMGDPDEEDYFRNWEDNLEDIFEQCFKYSQRVFGTNNYEAQCILFGKLYNKNYETINNINLKKEEKYIQEEITRLEKKLEDLRTKVTYYLPELGYATNNAFTAEINKYEKWKSGYDKELEDLKEGTPTYNEKLEKVTRYQEKIDKYKKLLV